MAYHPTTILSTPNGMPFSKISSISYPRPLFLLVHRLNRQDGLRPKEFQPAALCGLLCSNSGTKFASVSFQLFRTSLGTLPFPHA